MRGGWARGAQLGPAQRQRRGRAREAQSTALGINFANTEVLRKEALKEPVFGRETPRPAASRRLGKPPA